MAGYKLNQSISNYDITTDKFSENLSRISDNSEAGLRSSADNFYIGQVVSGFGLAPVEIDRILGRRIKVDVARGQATDWEHFF